jgi:hypothetical protein
MSCAPEVFNKGRFLIDMTQSDNMPVAKYDEICLRLTEATSEKVIFDWHYMGGRPMLLYLGDHATAKKAFLDTSEWIRQEVDAHADRSYAKESEAARWRAPGRSNLGLPNGPKISEPEMISMGQFLNRK